MKNDNFLEKSFLNEDDFENMSWNEIGSVSNMLMVGL